MAQAAATSGHGAAALRASGVSVELGGKTIVDEANVRVDFGCLVAIVGPNGAGKSTLVRAIAGIQQQTSGDVRCGDRQVCEMSGRELALTRAFVPQRALVPTGVRVREAVAIGRSVHVKPWQRPGNDDRAAIDIALERTGVSRLADRALSTLSGGELQRVQIAVALAQDATLIIADEPTSHLDLGATVAIAKLLRGLADDGLAVLMVVHDLSLAAAIADEVVVMSDGRTVAAGSPFTTLSRELLAEIWGVEASLESTDDECTALQVAWLKGERRPMRLVQKVPSRR